MGLIQRAPLRLGRVDDGLQPTGHLAEGVDQVGEEFEFRSVPVCLRLLT